MSETIRVAHTRRAAGNAPMRMAIERGYFAERGVDVVMREYPRGAVAVEAVEAGQADAAVVGGALLHLAMRGADPRIVMNIEAWNVFAIIGARGIETPEDLRGKRVGVCGPHDADTFIMKRALRDWQMDPERDVELVVFGEGRSAQWTAVLEGSIEAMACTVPEPLHARAVGLPILRDFADPPEPYQSGSLTTTKRFADAKPELLQTFLEGQLAGVRAYQEDFDAALPHLRDLTKIDDVEVLRETHRLFGMAMGEYVPRVEPLTNTARDLADALGSPLPFRVADLVDPSFALRLQQAEDGRAEAPVRPR